MKLYNLQNELFYRQSRRNKDEETGGSLDSSIKNISHSMAKAAKDEES
jgi:hypothetical protein